jgi:hypothetical protein
MERAGCVLTLLDMLLEVGRPSSSQDHATSFGSRQRIASPPMATSKSPTYGHPKSPRQDQLNCNGVCCFNAH